MVDEDELEKLREEKREELQQSEDQEADQLERQRENIKQRASKYLSSEAQSRLGNVRAAKPELASMVETQVARLGEMGRIDKMSDDELKDILKEIQEDRKDGSNISFRR